jgi:microcin C transport system permease protein
MISLSPITQQRWQRFRSLRRGWWSFLIIGCLSLMALLGPLLVGQRALIVHYQNQYHFPFLQGYIPAHEFGLNADTEPNYRWLQKTWQQEKSPHWLIMPLIPFSPTEVCEVNLPVYSKETAQGRIYTDQSNQPLPETRLFEINPDGSRGSTWSIVNGQLHGDYRLRNAQGDSIFLGKFANGKALSQPAHSSPYPGEKLFTFIPYPTPPGMDGHWLGTDESGHDVLARLFGGFQILLGASCLYMVATYAIGIFLGAAMGYFGGWFDLIMQRFIEIWSNIPFLYAIVFLATLLEPGLIALMLILVAFSWIGLAHQMRAAAYREAARDYVLAARALGASHSRIIFKHILPNTISVMITMAPFSVAAVVASLSALDYLGFGLPPTVPSWGDLLRQGKENWSAWWIITSIVTSMVGLLIMVNFIGEAMREAFDPKKYER